MFKRLIILFLLAAATVSVSVPAHASTLTVDFAECIIQSYSGYNGIYTCYADVSGGTGSYVSYTWNVLSNRGNYTLVTTTNTINNRTCYAGPGTREEFLVRVTVQDSAGATAIGYTYKLRCGDPMP